MKLSLFSSSLRAFFITFFAALGFGIAIVPITLIWSGIGSVSEGYVQSPMQPVPSPNSHGVLIAPIKDTPVILQIDIKGVIGERGNTFQDVESQLVASQVHAPTAGKVRGVLLTVNSPGGTVFDSDAIYRALIEYKERYNVPIYAYVDGLCASGGLYISCAADKIYSSPSSSIGSVGVIGHAFNYSKLAEMIGVDTRTLCVGKGKDELDSWRPWREDEGVKVKKLMQQTYERFVDLVTQHRNIDRDALVDDWGAEVFPAKEALEKCFIDQIEDRRSRAIEELARASKVDPKTCAVLQLRPKLGLRYLIAAGQAMLPNGLQHEVRVSGLGLREAQDPLGLYYQLST